jgi:hypothetical protein
MNERIKELSKQAQQYAEYVTPQGCECLDTFKEKFAELIVKDIMENLSFHGHEDAVSQVQWHAANKYGIKV